MENWKSALPEAIRAKFESFSDDAEGLSKLGNSYVETKSMVGGRVKAPDINDTEGMGEFYNKYGRPEAYDGYDVKYEVGEGAFDLFTPMMETFHEAGISNSNMQKIISKFDEIQNGFMDQMTADEAAQREEQNGLLKKEWGDGHDEKRAAAVEAARRTLGDGYADRLAQSTDMEAFIGFDKLAASMGEDGAHGNDRGSFKMTPTEAQTEMSDMRGNLDHPFHKGDPAAVARMSELTEAAMPEGDNEVIFSV